MNWNSIMGFVSSFALFSPILLIITLGLSRYRSFPILLVYYFSVFIYNLITEHYIIVSVITEHNWGMINNLADAPMLILFLTYFSTSRIFTQRLKLLTASFVLLEAIVLSVVGFNTDAITIILGPGLLIIFGLCLYFFIRNTKHAIENRKATGKALIVTALLFGYGCYFIIYLLYYVFKAHINPNGTINVEYMKDTFLVYFIATTLSTILMSTGLLVEHKRIRKLKELRITRKELSGIYTETKRAAPLRTAMLDFDREQWN